MIIWILPENLRSPSPFSLLKIPSGTIHSIACCMNASTMAFVPKESPEGTHSSLKMFLMTILIQKRLLVKFCKSLTTAVI